MNSLVPWKAEQLWYSGKKVDQSASLWKSIIMGVFYVKAVVKSLWASISCLSKRLSKQLSVGLRISGLQLQIMDFKIPDSNARYKNPGNRSLITDISSVISQSQRQTFEHRHYSGQVRFQTIPLPVRTHVQLPEADRTYMSVHQNCTGGIASFAGSILSLAYIAASSCQANSVLQSWSHDF